MIWIFQAADRSRPPRTNAAIVRRTLEGHPEAFEPLVFRYQKKAHAIAHSLGLRRPEIDDAVHLFLHGAGERKTRLRLRLHHKALG